MTASAARPLVALATALAIASCSIPPKPDLPDLRNEAPLAGVAAPQGGAWPDSEWWRRYADDQLDGLEQKALASAPSLDEARKRFGTALSSVEIARAAGGASFQANAQAQRQRLSEHGLIPPEFLGFTWYNQGDLSLQFQYDFDFWGKTRAAVAASVDEAHAAEAERSAAALLLTTAVADTYFGWQADQVRLALAKDTVTALERTRELAAKRVARGIDAPDTVHQADAQIAAARELEAGYAGSAPIRLAALAALLGVAPAELPALAAKPLPMAEAALPNDVGIDLLARRPDIAASRWRVEAALQRVNQARAEFYPDISLGAMVGLSSIDLDKLLTGGSRVAGIGPALHLPVFGQGRLRAAYGVTQAQLQAAAAQYDAAVVDAARDVATQALNLQQIDARRGQRMQQVDATRALEDTAAARVRRGVTDDRSLLGAKAQVLQQRDAVATLDAQAISAQIALTKALGGGYRMQRATAPDAAGGDTTESPKPPINAERADSR
ncbi:efflux transporter outer membrane subunit [Dokdonella soli]|uniref:Multidrug efflux transporter outer membrane subunit MdtP n=1 Tax=Dokdonella soli TaxID=529810 RepID=A0ABP3THI0_9GAMM